MIEYKNKKILVLGAGGSATSIVYGLLQNGADIDIYNRTQSRAIVLKDKFDSGITNPLGESYRGIYVIAGGV